MTRFQNKLFAGIMFIFLLLPLCAMCEVEEGTFHISPMAGGYFFEGNQPIKSGPVVALGLAYNISDNIGLELMGKAGEFDFYFCNPYSNIPFEDSLYGYWAHMDILYHLWPKERLVPYLALGGGYMWLDDDRYLDTESPFAHYGAGFFYRLTEKIHLRGDVRHVLPFDDEHNNLSAVLGITLAFGKKAPQAPIDSDHDGVFDHNDHCPDTPVGVKVDQWGCPLDHDKDGVPDFEDKCPNTPPGAIVDKYGCIADKDQDGDGVKDSVDRCPDTPKGTKVDRFGCKAIGDIDGDGVPDHIDRCPNTPLVAEVNSVGCWVIKDLHFDFDKAVIKKKDYKSLDKIVEILKKNPFLNVEIQGHTDNRGGKQYNKKLSEARAKAVAKYMITHGIRAARLSYVGYGYEIPIATNKTEEGRSLNRRVQIKPMK
jgi:OOP family OmpA-OmpF porin